MKASHYSLHNEFIMNKERLEKELKDMKASRYLLHNEFMMNKEKRHDEIMNECIP